MKNRLATFILCLSSVVFLAGCGDSYSESIIFKVTSYNKNFTGSYAVDGSGDVSFIGTSIENDAYSYRESLTVNNQLEVDASPNADTTSDTTSVSISVKVYKNNELVKTVEASKSPSERLQLLYEVGDSSE